MAWRHYETRQTGECEVFGAHGPHFVKCNMGLIETGRSRVFAGYFVRIIAHNGEELTGEDGQSLRDALADLSTKAAQLYLRLNCAGLSPTFTESGLSYNSGWGYWGREVAPIHMIHPEPVTDSAADDLDEMIREAVDGMQIDFKPELGLRQP